MSRPSAPTIVRIAMGRTHNDLIVKGVETLWYLTYQGQPFQLVKEDRYRPDRSPKYLRTAWPSSTTAETWARRLNNYFGCNDFKVECL